MVSIKVASVTKEEVLDKTQNEILTQSPRLDSISWDAPMSPSQEDARHRAAIKLQKVYKSFRTRRQLADCAVLAERSWWNLLDSAELIQNSISFFDQENQATAFSRWCRAKNKAAKVGKGLSKSGKARKLAVQHWLEAIDPRHRYGHNLHFYYAEWLLSQSRQAFFYWLDIGEGKEVNLIVKCPRPKLQQQCIKYLGPLERKAYEVVIKDGMLFFQQSGEIIDTTTHGHSKWIFVLSTSKMLYIGKKKKGTFQHSSFLAGGVTSAAGRLVVAKGILMAVWPHSGHYKPTPENFQDFLSYLKSKNVDLSGVELSPVDEDEPSLHRQDSSRLLSSNSAEDELNQDTSLQMDTNTAEELTEDKTEAIKQVTAASPEEVKSRCRSLNINTNLPDLEIPKWDAELLKGVAGDNDIKDNNSKAAEHDPSSDDQALEEEENELVSKEKILQRINSRGATNSYQLGKQLCSKWTTGAGPRIGCLRDYPSELQLRALELVNLSPRCCNGLRSSRTPHQREASSLWESTPTAIVP